MNASFSLESIKSATQTTFPGTSLIYLGFTHTFRDFPYKTVNSLGGFKPLSRLGAETHELTTFRVDGTVHHHLLQFCTKADETQY